MRPNLILGLSILIFGLVVVFLWVPADTETGIFEKVRRKFEIGDGFAPTLSGLVLILSGMLLLLELRRPALFGDMGRIDPRFVLEILFVLALSLVLMRWAGPVAASFLAADGAEYRTLRDTIPWKYVGFLLGGVVMVTGGIVIAERRFSLSALAVGIAAVLALITVYDLPFEDLLLPPNGDV